MNSTRRKWFLKPDDPAPVDQPVSAAAPAREVIRPDRESVLLAVGAATTLGFRRYGAGARPVRRNSGRWSG
ncbi:hypothetical protein BDK92_3725 [Micromonospora pisi]|uniref:Uncharacterized protein n=1 Tax=Micromonospora pisi TaxID=589240 RepID=A0A495JKM5_9ACTN|nr:hypothetical protein [Micromonospora pisi]RKR89381.1 hypothetical protein BDK92_3725 [Micromonospora pisi]